MAVEEKKKKPTGVQLVARSKDGRDDGPLYEAFDMMIGECFPMLKETQLDYLLVLKDGWRADAEGRLKQVDVKIRDVEDRMGIQKGKGKGRDVKIYLNQQTFGDPSTLQNGTLRFFAHEALSRIRGEDVREWAGGLRQENTRLEHFRRLLCPHRVCRRHSVARQGCPGGERSF